MLINTSLINWKGSINVSITKTGPETLFCSAGEEKESPLKSSKQKKNSAKIGIHEMLLSKIE